MCVTCRWFRASKSSPSEYTKLSGLTGTIMVLISRIDYTSGKATTVQIVVYRPSSKRDCWIGCIPGVEGRIEWISIRASAQGMYNTRTICCAGIAVLGSEQAKMFVFDTSALHLHPANRVIWGKAICCGNVHGATKFVHDLAPCLLQL